MLALLALHRILHKSRSVEADTQTKSYIGCCSTTRLVLCVDALLVALALAVSSGEHLIAPLAFSATNSLLAHNAVRKLK